MVASVLAPFAGAGAWLLVEVDGATEREAAARAEEAAALARRQGALVRVLTDPAAQAGVWEVREGALGATAFLPDGRHAWEGWEDSAVAPERLGGYLRGLQALLRDYRYEAAFYGHFGDGCVHVRITFDLESSAGVSQFRSFVEHAADLVVAHGGSLSGEHGDGQARGELLKRMYGPELTAGFSAFKRLWDPEGRMNPGKVVDPRPLDRPARGACTQPPRPHRLPLQGRRLRPRAAAPRGAALPPTEGGTMCPSFRATRDGGTPRGARARPPRDAARRGRQGRMERPRGRGGTRPVPRLQGLRARMPRRCRPRDLEGGVLPSPLAGKAAAAGGSRLRTRRPLAPPGRAHAAPVERHGGGPGTSLEGGGGDRA